MTLVCKHWLQASQIAKVLKNYKLSFSFVTIGPTEEQLTLFANSDRVFSNIYFGNAKFKSIDPVFWGNWSDHITELTFDYKFRTADIPGGNFVELLKFTPRLKTLNLICSLGLFNAYLDELSVSDRCIVSENMKSIQELQMYFSEECLKNLTFGSWIDQLTHLKNVDFDVHSKKSPIPSDAYLEIFKFVRKFSTKIKGLHICDNSRALRKEIAEEIFAIKELKLKALDLIINSASATIFTNFLCTQSELQYLTVNGLFSLAKSLHHMPKLKEIAMSNGLALHGFKVFDSMDKLESLGIAGLEFYDEDDLDDTFKMTVKPKLKELYLIDATIDFGWSFVKRMCDCYANIRLLNLDGAMIDDSGLAYVFQLKKLQELKLSNTEITDCGFAGSLPPRKKLKTSNGRSVSLDESAVTISSLKELEVLNIDFCKHLSSHSFNSMKLNKLKHFSAQGTQLNGSHVPSLEENCPKIESLNVSKCYQLNENDVRAFVRLKHLETFELESCIHIDLACIKHIMKSDRLQTLNFSKCSMDVRSVAGEMFMNMKSLRRIILDKERLYRCNYVEAKS